jgi:signal transduction histidine kinase
VQVEYDPDLAGDHPGRDRKVRAAIIAATGLLVAMILAHLVFALLKERQDVLSTARTRVENLAQVIEEQTGGSVAAVEVALAGAAATTQLLPKDSETREAELHKLLVDSVNALPFVRAIWIIDANGDMIHDSESLPGHYNLADRDYFRLHRDNPAQDVLIEPPILSKHGVWFIGISRRIDAADGSFAGVIAAALEPKYLQRFYESINVGKEGVVTLLQPDGTIMARAPLTEERIGQKLAPLPPLVDRLRQGPSGTFRAISLVDGVARIFAYRLVGGRSLVVVAGLGEEEVLAGWWTAARANILASLAFVLVIAWLGYLILRELRRRSALTETLALDILARKKTEALLECQRRVLELVAVGAPLAQTLEGLVHTLEEQTPEMVASILLLDADGLHLRHGAAPSLPKDFVIAVDGLAIGAQAGSCGTAAFRSEPVIVEDITIDPLWQDYPKLIEMATAHGLYACWSTPILDADRRVLGTFALYFHEAGRPSERHRRLIAMATHIAAIAIAKSREEATQQNLVSRLRELSRRLLEVEETERRRINRELHDRIGQNLSTLNLNLDLLRSQLPESTPSALGGRIDDAQRLLASLIGDVRSVMAELHPPALDDFGLLAALRTYADTLGARVGLPIAVRGEEFTPRLSPAVEMALFRVAQGALANATQHAKAKSIEVTLESTADRVRLRIADDGVGFDTGRARPAQASWGLAIMRERAEAVGGRLHLESAAGRGTRVVAEVARETA